jgi:adenine-specific DNA-methyltransferase
MAPKNALKTEQLIKRSISPVLEASTITELCNNNPLEALQNGKFMIRAWIRSLDKKVVLPSAQTFVFQTITAYWNEVHDTLKPGYPLPFFFKKIAFQTLDEAVLSVAEAIGIAAARLPVIDASYHLGNVYTALLPEEARSGAGVFYTPPSLTGRLMEMAEDAGIDWATSKIIDPACGGGAFLAPIADKICAKLKHLPAAKVLAHIQRNLVGWEIDPFGGWLTQVFLEVALKDIIHAAETRPIPMVQILDSLQTPPLSENERFDLVIGNPPYGKLKLTEKIRNKYKESLYGHPNYYGLFTHLALTLAKKGGVIAFLTPTSFLSGEYFKNLRKLIRECSTPLEFDFVSFRKGVFEDVLQETMLATYLVQPHPLARLSVNQLITNTQPILQISPAGEFYLPANLTAPWILPRTPQQSPSVQTMQHMRSRLSDWGYKVSTGPLVWNRHKDQLLDKSKTKNVFPVIWAEAVTADGNFIWRAEKKNHKPWFKFCEGDDWLITRKPCILLQRTTAKEQDKRLIAAALSVDLLKEKKGVVIENHLNMIIPIKDDVLVPPETLAVFLNSRATNEAFRAISGSVAVSAYELESLPLPEVDQLKPLTRSIQENHSARDMEDICFQLYNRHHV